MMGRAIVAAVALLGAFSTSFPARAQSAMDLVSTIPLPGVKGRIDHLSVDTKGHRLFIATLGNDTVEVVDTQGGKRGARARQRSGADPGVPGPLKGQERCRIDAAVKSSAGGPASTQMPFTMSRASA